VSDERIKIKLRDLLGEVMVHHVNNAFQRVMIELKDDPETDQKLSEVIMNSRQATEVTLSISAMTGLPPPQAATALNLGVALGIGLVLELLNEREINDMGGPPIENTPSGTTVQ
jgi:hypothetical protein